jgi:hypothetical protein
MLAIHRRRRKGELGVFIPRSSCVRPGASTHAADPRLTGRVHEAKSFDGSPDVSAARQTRARPDASPRRPGCASQISSAGFEPATFGL